ncbi:hypothetical protein [Sphaerothrix gracilis]|uniref:hypothetical protein n=1 Tax=Sphaerothrix gracilis TaxID=3151835 RepID=UPI0031FD16B2
MNQLLYLTVDLFLYDLQDGLGSTLSTTDEGRRRFWQRIYGEVGEEKLAALQEVENTFSNHIELLGAQGGQRYQKLSDEINGYYYPVKLGDTYALQIDYSGRLNDPDWDQLSLREKLQQAKETVLEYTHQIRGDLGENWLLWGQLTDANQEAEAIAQDCYRALQITENPNWQRDRKGKGIFQGATLFEIERLDDTPDGVNRTMHAIICLFPHEQSKSEIQQTINQLYKNLIHLLHYRNKILWVYEQSRQLKIQLRTTSQRVEKIVNSLTQHIETSQLNLKQLQEDLATALTIFHYYETNLVYLREQMATITINTNNYKARIEQLKNLDPDNDFNFLCHFSEFAADQYIRTIKTEDEAFRAGSKPLENFIKTVEGIIDIEKAKNDRTFNRTVAIASVGISTASLAASTFGGQSEKIIQIWRPVPANQPTPALNLWLSFGLAFFLSVAIGLSGAFLTWLFLGKSGRN